MFAIIKTGGKQYKVAPGDTLTIEKLPNPGKTVQFTDVLLLGGDKTVVGKPTIAGATVTAEVIGESRGEKLRVFKYQAKSQWSKTRGHRQGLLSVKIKEVVSPEGKENRGNRKVSSEVSHGA